MIPTTTFVNGRSVIVEGVKPYSFFYVGILINYSHPLPKVCSPISTKPLLSTQK